MDDLTEAYLKDMEAAGLAPHRETAREMAELWCESLADVLRTGNIGYEVELEVPAYLHTHVEEWLHDFWERLELVMSSMDD